MNHLASILQNSMEIIRIYFTVHTAAEQGRRLTEIAQQICLTPVKFETEIKNNIYKLKYFTEPFFHKFKKSALHILNLRDWLITWPFLIDKSAIGP